MSEAEQASLTAAPHSAAPVTPHGALHRIGDAEASVLIALYVLLAGALFREITGTQLLATLGTYNLSVIDPAFAFICISAVICWLTSPPNINIATVPALCLAALIVVSFLRGLEEGVFQAFYWLRSEGFLAPILIIGATLRPSAAWYAKARSAIMIAALVIGLIVLLRLVFGVSLFFVVDVDDPLSINDGGRPITSFGAILLAVGVLFTTAAVLRPQGRRRGRDLLLLALLGLALLLSFQATSAIAAGAALVALFLLEHPSRDRSIIVLATIALFGFGYANQGAWIDILPTTISQAVEQRSNNLGTRTSVWSGFATQFATESITDRAVGVPAGRQTTVTVFISNHWRLWQRSLHSMYVGLIAKVGLLGLLAYLAFLVAALGISASLVGTVHRIGAFTPALSIALLILAMIEGYSYDLRQEMLLLILLPMLFVAQARWSPIASDALSGIRPVNNAPRSK